jgi:cyclopropane fatty-acyl-phospholipid synthase-like methyltransferase
MPFWTDFKKMKGYWILIYKGINDLFKEDIDFVFMNHGYFPIHKNVSTDSLFKSQESLYHFVFESVKNKKIENLLEIGCGRGGGTHSLKKTYNLENVYACDLSKSNIKFAKKFFSNINFQQCDAEKINYEKNFFDVVINIESSHCYQDLNLFFSGVSNTMKNDGVFLYADIFSPLKINSIKNDIKKYFKIVFEKNISENVLSSCIYTAELMSNPKFSEQKHVFFKNLSKNASKNYLNKNAEFYFFVLTKKGNV